MRLEQDKRGLPQGKARILGASCLAPYSSPKLKTVGSTERTVETCRRLVLEVGKSERRLATPKIQVRFGEIRLGPLTWRAQEIIYRRGMWNT